jgi:selenocysteine lyase/cysteine desulfurase
MITEISGENILRNFRRKFPPLTENIYMDVAARGLISTDVRQEIDRYLDSRMIGGDKPLMFRQAEETRELFATFVNAHPDEISFAKNTSDGINAFANAVNWREGDNIVICQHLEHPANIISWRNLEKRGVRIIDASPDQGHISIEKILQSIDERTRLVAVSTISFAPGFKTPVDELAEECRKRNILLMVDAAQSVGVMQMDVQEMGIDAMAVSAQKGLLGLYGFGFLYVRRQVAERLSPAYLSRFGVQIASGHEASIGAQELYEYADGARRFDVGNPNFIAAIAVRRSLLDLMEIGAGAIEDHCRRLSLQISNGLRELGLPVYGPGRQEHRSHIVSVGPLLTDEHDTVSDPSIADFSSYLARNRVGHSIRRGLLRLSVHAYNDDSDVDALLELARRWNAGPRAREK